MTEITVTGYGKAKKLSVLSREKIVEIIQNLNMREVFFVAYQQYQHTTHTGIAAVRLSDGKLIGDSEEQGTIPHPLDVVRIDIYSYHRNNFPAEDPDLMLEESEQEAFDAFYKKGDLPLEKALRAFIETTDSSWDERLSAVEDWLADIHAPELDLDDIQLQLEEYYRRGESTTPH